jgi:phytol kinase
MSLGFIALFSVLGFVEVEPRSVVGAVAAISLAATVVESLPINNAVDDNLSVPGVSALMGCAADTLS